MTSSSPSFQTPGRLLSLSAEVGRAETVETAVTRAVELAETTFDQPVVNVCAYDAGVGTVTVIGSSSPSSAQTDSEPDRIPEVVLERSSERSDDPSTGDIPQATVDADPRGALQAEVLVPVGCDRLLRLGVTDPDGFDEADVAAVEGIAANLETALARIDSQRAEPQQAERPIEDDTTMLRRLNELTVNAEKFDETIERLLSLGCDYFGLDTGILSSVDGDDYEVEAVVDATKTHEAGTVYDLGETMCDATLTGEVTESLAFADVAETDHRSHPAAENVSAYIAAPVVVDGEAYGTVNFSMGRPRSAAFRSEEEAFVKLVAQWVGTEVERRRRFGKLERYETILEAVDDPVYALDTEGRFTFVNEAAKREFGYGEEMVGERPSVGMDQSDVERIRDQIRTLLATGERSTTAEFELETAAGGHKTVENRLGLIGDDEFRGTAGVLRDITARKERRRQLESFQQAIESARDGVAVLDGDEYTYVDRSHVEMYGFEDKDELLGSTWQKLYDDAEVERLEAEAFPALESEGYWRGMVTGSRPDGSTFPAELSLTIIEDGRLVCTVRDETERKQRERELELKERAMDEADVGIQITDPTKAGNPLVYVNEGFEQMTGYAREEALGRSPGFLDGEDTDPGKMTRLREAVDAERGVSLELRHYRKDGTPFWSRRSLTPVTDGDGAVQRYIGIQQDITERRERERQIEARRDFLERIYELTTDPGLTFEEKISALLEAGRNHLDLPYGFLTRIERGDDSMPGTQTIIESVGSHEHLQPGESAPLEQSYCRKTIERDDPVALTHATEDGWVDDPAYETFELETYVGAEVVAGEDCYGTLCFGSKGPREAAFDEFERSFVRLVGRWAGYEIDRRNNREELRDQRERLELTLSGTGTGLAEWDLATDGITWSETLVEIVGREPDSIGEFWAAIHPNDRDRVQRELETMVETGDPWAGEFRMGDGDGDTLWLGTRATPVYNGDEEPVRVLATGSDISERKKTERERQRNERRFESLFDDPEMLVALLDTDGTLLAVNETAMGYVDASREALEGESFAETPWWSHSADLQADMREWIRRAADGEYVEYDANHPGSDGDTRRITGTVRPVTTASGSVESLVVSGRDVTERDRQQQELRDRQRKLDLILSNTDTAVAELNLQTGTMRWEEEIGDGTLSSPETVEGFVDTIHPDDREQVQSDLAQMASTGDTLRRTIRVLNETGGYTWIAAQAVPIEDEQDGTKIVAIATDVTDLKQQEATLRASEQRYRSLAENIPNGGVLTFDADLEYRLAAGELLSDFGIEASDIPGTAVGTALPDSEVSDELVPPIRAALDGERTDRRVEIDGRTLRIYIAPVDAGDGRSDETRGLILAQDITEDARREQELFEERERFRLLTESVDEYAFFIVGESRTIQTWNESAEDTFGYDTEAALGMSVAELHPEADRESGLPDRLLQQARVGGESAHEGWRVRADGSEFYADVRHAPLEADSGEFRGYATVVRDMTDRRRQQRRTERFVEQSNEVVTIVDTDGTLTYASGSADRVLGYDPDDLVGENLFDYTHPDSREGAMEAFFTGTEAPGADFGVECRMTSGDGEWLNVEWECRNMLDDDAIDGMLLYLRDVTERKERTRRFESIFNQTFQFTGLLEPDGTVVEINDAALEFGGISREAVVGEPFYDAPLWTHSEAVHDNARNAIERAANGEFVRYEAEVRGGDGLATVDFSAKPVTDDTDEVSLLVVEGRDISSQQQQKRHMDVMQRVMRHNMRNDLTKVRGWTEMMSEEADAEKRAEQFETVRRILDKWGEMAEKMKQMRQLAQSRAGERTTSEVGSLLEDAVSPVRAEHPDATVVTEAPDTESIQVPVTTRDAVRELVENAAEASEDATVAVEVTSPEEDWVEVGVRDDGPGLPDTEATVLETGEETQLNHGKGLGLWMVRTIATQAGGDISVESTGDGTEVCLQLPTRQATGEAWSAETGE